MQNGFLGITVSSEQIGWAVTNPKYELERASRKDLWGVRLFDMNGWTSGFRFSNGPSNIS